MTAASTCSMDVEAAVASRVLHVRNAMGGEDIARLDALYGRVRAEETAPTAAPAVSKWLPNRNGPTEVEATAAILQRFRRLHFSHPNLAGRRDNSHIVCYMQSPRYVGTTPCKSTRGTRISQLTGRGVQLMPAGARAARCSREGGQRPKPPLQDTRCVYGRTCIGRTFQGGACVHKHTARCVRRTRGARGLANGEGSASRGQRVGCS